MLYANYMLFNLNQTAFMLHVIEFEDTRGNRGAAHHFEVDESNVRL